MNTLEICVHEFFLLFLLSFQSVIKERDEERWNKSNRRNDLQRAWKYPLEISRERRKRTVKYCFFCRNFSFYFFLLFILCVWGSPFHSISVFLSHMCLKSICIFIGALVPCVLLTAANRTKFLICVMLGLILHFYFIKTLHFHWWGMAERQLMVVLTWYIHLNRSNCLNFHGKVA